MFAQAEKDSMDLLAKKRAVEKDKSTLETVRHSCV